MIREHDASDQHWNRHHLSEGELLAEVDRLTRENTELRAKVADYENGINWGVTCTGCASQMDVHYDGWVKGNLAGLREGSGDAVHRLKAVARALDDEEANLADDGARLSHSVVRRIRAALSGDVAQPEPDHG